MSLRCLVSLAILLSSVPSVAQNTDCLNRCERERTACLQSAKSDAERVVCYARFNKCSTACL